MAIAKDYRGLSAVVGVADYRATLAVLGDLLCHPRSDPAGFAAERRVTRGDGAVGGDAPGRLGNSRPAALPKETP